ncbi:MAG: ABC-2 family transporter protein [Candidatus Hodarchaeales archaeon]
MVMLLISLLFWQVIFLNTTQFGNWTFEAVLILHLYSQVFAAIFLVFFMGCHVFWRSVQTGRLDVFLTRPLDPRIAFLAEQIRFHGSYRLFINLIVIGAILAYLKVKIDYIHFSFTLTMVILSVFAIGLMQLTANCISFWWIRSDAIDEFLDFIFEFYRYPLTVLPWVVQVLLTVGMPIIFAATWPALFLTDNIDFMTFFSIFGFLLLVIVFWFILLQIAWNAGLRRYESGGG